MSSHLTPIQFILISDLLLINFLLLSLATKQQLFPFDKICQEKLEPFIDKSYQELASYVSAYDQKMQMKRENIADRGIWTAKKRYILNVWDSEGVRYEEPKLKIMGIEAVKSSTPAPCRKMIKDGLKLVMTGTEEDVIRFIDKSRDEFKKMSPLRRLLSPEQFQM